jgi:hypothetical protein
MIARTLTARTSKIPSPPARPIGLLFTLRSLAAVVALAAAPLAIGSCAHLPSVPTGGFRVDCNLTDATVWIDDEPVGNVSAWKAGRPIRAGFHRIEIRYPGTYSVFKEIDLPVDGQIVMVAKLRETLE